MTQNSGDGSIWGVGGGIAGGSITIGKKIFLQFVKTIMNDGFGPEFYNKIRQCVLEPLRDMYIDLFKKGRLPATLNMAYISLIQKKNKPSDKCRSYEPICMLNVDCKLLSKLLARRLELLLPLLINPDQTGFIQQRLSYSNIRRLLNVIQFAQTSKDQVLAISLDAEKAFDWVEWKYMFEVLGRFNLGTDLINWIQTLYCVPTACVITNGLRSLPFTLGRGTRQGCPFFPSSVCPGSGTPCRDY